MAKRKQGKKTSNGAARVQKLPPNVPAARDEGPRLLPLDGHIGRPEDPSLNRYLELADLALEQSKPSQVPPPRKRSRPGR